MMGSVYSGPLYDWGYLRPLVWVGSFLLVLGMFMTSLCKEYWQVLLAQGFLMGFGVGCLFVPATGGIAAYFSKRRGLAMGIATSGSTIGKSIGTLELALGPKPMTTDRRHHLPRHVP
jgi:MFS family permease